ncbi:Cid1 poly A polymerase family protein [Acanthocheilonema viteae]
MKSATARGLDSSKHAIADQNERQKIISDVSVISQPTGTKHQKISGNNTKRRGIHRRKRTSRYSAMSTLEIPLIAAENGYTQSEVVFRCTGMQSAIRDSNNLKWEVNDVSCAMNSELRNFWERQDMESDRKKRNKNKHKLKDSSFHLVAFTASTSVTEEYANAVASDSEPDVISLSDKEERENREAGTEFALLEQGDDFNKQLQTSPLIEKEVPKCLTASEELERRRVLDNAISRKIDNVNVLETGGIAAEKIDDCNGFDGTVEQLSGLNQSIKLIRTASSNLTARNKEQMEVDRNVCREKKHLATEVPLRDGPLFIQKDSFDKLNLMPGTHKFVQNGKVELKIDKPQGKDFIQVTLFECCGPLEDPKQVARGGYKICASVVLHENTSIEVMRQALIDLAEELEQISRDSFYSGEKLPYPVNKYSLPYLKKQYIYPLKKKSSRFPRAIYYCGLCQYHICSVPQAVTHFLSREHIDNREKEDSLKKLECLPVPASEQMSKIDQIIQELYVSAKLSDIQYEVGSQIANLLSHLLQNEARKNFSVMVYGSYMTRLATVHSNLNLALNFPQEYSLGHALSRVMEVLNNIALEKDFIVDSITSDLQRPDPSVHCIVNSVAVVITANCIRQQRATQLINLYCAICSQFRILATVFRSWAELCSLTNVQLGGLPKFAFDIILIYYLQHKGLLPFIFEILSEEEILLLDSESLQFEHQVDRINTNFGTGNEEWNFGEIWIGLFRYYAIEHPVEELIQIRWRKRYLAEDYIRWNKKRLAVEDPFASDHIMQPQQRINSYFSSCFLSTYIYFALPRTVVCSLIPYSVIKPGSVDIQLKKRRKRRSRKTTILNDSCTDETAPNNDEQDNKTDSDDIETNKMQITEADMNKQDFDGLTEAGLETMTQVRTNENDENSLASGKCQDLEVLVSDCAALRLDLNTSHNDLQKDDIDETYYDSNVTLTSQQYNIHFSELHLQMKELEVELPLTTQDLHVTEEYDGKELAEARLASASVLKIKFHDYDEMSIRKLWLALNSSEYNYSWALHYFTGGLEPMVRCTCCGADGHLRDNCPELMIPEPKNFPPLTNAQKKIINLVIFDIFNTMRIRPYYVHSMSALCRELEGFLRRFYRTDCHLSLFGSAGNGFGLLGSDADICLRFGRGVRPEDIDSAEVICRVAEVVRKMPGITFVSEIPHAKVPIVKFRCRNHLEADLSLYNVLALENTRLLRTYSKLDERIHKLGIMTKIWAKSCEIGNASKGSLSSYSYIIMLIHYLQRTNPPVAPFLQEIAPPGRCRKPVIIDDCDVYFCSFEDLEWTVYNRSTVGELWIGFLDYFGTKFDFTQEVVQIRQTQRLMKLDKGWQSRPIAIEDPFDLTHNLSSGVHSKTMAYIHKSFIQSREKFSTVPVPNSKLNHNSLIFYASALLSSCRVGNGPPLDRKCCHRCRQIGHFVMDCPLGMKDKKHNKQS